jgi:CDP-paratose 2-epimerase
MRTIIVTGSAGLIGSETVKRFATQGARFVGIDNDMRAQLFGAEASTKKTRDDLITNVRSCEYHDLDIRDACATAELLKLYHRKIDAIVHTASQPSHDWAARDPQTDFTVNANGTLNLLEAAKNLSPQAPFIFTSTNKVYGDTPNRLPLGELSKRSEIELGHEYKSGMSETTATGVPSISSRAPMSTCPLYAPILELRTITAGACHPYVPMRVMNPNRANVCAPHKKS